MEKNYVSKDSEFKLNVSEPLSQWGGLWTEEKLDTFTKYVNAYLTIMNKQRNKYGWVLIYFDGFAGSGSRCEEINNPSGLLLELFQGDRINQDELNLYQGEQNEFSLLNNQVLIIIISLTIIVNQL